jgi:hypothetical protein
MSDYDYRNPEDPFQRDTAYDETRAPATTQMKPPATNPSPASPAPANPAPPVTPAPNNSAQ